MTPAVLECRVPKAEVVSELDFYRELQRLNPADPATRVALTFSRVFTDLARRVLAAQDAQRGFPAEPPPALGLPALRAYLFAGANLSSADFLNSSPAYGDGDRASLLADLATWLARKFDPADPLACTYQVWAGQLGDREIALFGPPHQPPAAPLAMREASAAETWLLSCRERPIALIAHYDVHGLAMLALTLRYLRGLGVEDVDCTLSFELTGDISKLWKRTVPRAITSERNYSAIVMIDCSVHSRKPERTLKALDRLTQAPETRFFLVDHHDDTQRLAPSLLRDRLHLVLTDIPSCALCRATDSVDRDLAVLGALGDKVPEIVAGFPPEQYPELHAANEAFHQRLIYFSPTPKEMKDQGQLPLRSLWEALADGQPVAPATADNVLGRLPLASAPDLPDYAVCGSLLFVTDRLHSVGRTWYAILERLMQLTDIPYAAALRILDDRRANMLLLTHWQAVHLPPVRYFVPRDFQARCLGHMAAVWIDVSKADALTLLGGVAANLNGFLNTPAEFGPIGQLLDKRIIEAPLEDVTQPE
jgi:hypothetical protein